MESISRKVDELSPDERRLYESMLGHALRKNQQVIIHVVELDVEPDESDRGGAVDRAIEIARRGRAAAAEQGFTSEQADQAIDKAIQETRRTKP